MVATYDNGSVSTKFCCIGWGREKKGSKILFGALMIKSSRCFNYWKNIVYY